MQNLIQIRQLPIIEEHLQQVKEEVTAKVKEAQALICNDETVKTVKSTRADLNKIFKEYESKRKEVKKQY